MATYEDFKKQAVEMLQLIESGKCQEIEQLQSMHKQLHLTYFQIDDTSRVPIEIIANELSCVIDVSIRKFVELRAHDK